MKYSTQELKARVTILLQPVENHQERKKGNKKNKTEDKEKSQLVQDEHWYYFNDDKVERLQEFRLPRNATVLVFELIQTEKETTWLENEARSVWYHRKVDMLKEKVREEEEDLAENKAEVDQKLPGLTEDTPANKKERKKLLDRVTKAEKALKKAQENV